MPKASSSSTRSSNSEIPFTRRRLLPEQIAALQALFEAKSHPSKEERGAIAAELGLELKSVNVWYQNRRRSAKKQALAWKPENASTSTRRNKKPSGSKIATSLSLDRIAASRERRDLSSRVSRSPLTPKANRAYTDQIPPATDIWDHIPSSPQAPPSSPGAESARLSKLPSGSKTLRSLEWACAKARAEGMMEHDSDDDFDVPVTDYDPPRATHTSTIVKMEEMVLDDGHDTDVDLDEAITPNTSVELPSVLVTPTRHYGRLRSKENNSPLPAEQVEAAMTLLVFKDS
ncbi:unnamed protein product [Somion occarium]|uniref:Homeobox domain-containing protein n=1 Tax=Somion occarium TaxID=3059160 RepID=A0ABP1CH88_9APHY